MVEPPRQPVRPVLERSTVRIAIAVAILGVLFGVAVMVGRRGGSNDAQPSVQATPAAAPGALDSEAPVVGQLAPDFALRSSDGSLVKLSDLRGKVVWLNFWATWCVPCKQELPDIQKLYDEKHDAGLEVLAINYQEGRTDALAYFKARKLTIPLLLDSGSVFNQYKLNGLPDSFFIDRDGKLSSMYIGQLSASQMQQHLAAAGLR